MAYWDETSPGWRSQPTILGNPSMSCLTRSECCAYLTFTCNLWHSNVISRTQFTTSFIPAAETALVGFIAKIRSYVSANLRVTTTDSSLFDDGDESNVDTSSDTYPLTTNPGYEMPWWAPVLDHIHEVDLDKLTEDITIRQETDAKPYFEYDDMFLTLLLIPSGVDTLANADSDTSFGTYVDSSANHSTNSLSSGTAVHVESPLRLSTPKSIVNWSSKPLLSVSSEAGNAKLPAAALDSIIKDVSTPEMDTPLGKVKTSASTAAKLATAPVSRPLMHWSSTPLLSDNTLLNSTATDRSALQPSFMLTRPDAGLASAVHMHATAGIAAGATPTAALGALSSATIAAVGNKVVADEDGGDDCVGDKAVGEKDKKDEGSPVKPALAAAVTAILAGNASAANEAARASHGAQIAVPNVADKTARKNLGLLRVSFSTFSLACIAVALSVRSC